MSLGPYVCVECMIELRCHKNAVLVVEMGTQGSLAAYSADVWRCPECGMDTLAGISRNPVVAGTSSEVEEYVKRDLMLKGKVYRIWLNDRERSAFVANYGPAWDRAFPVAHAK